MQKRYYICEGKKKEENNGRFKIYDNTNSPADLGWKILSGSPEEVCVLLRNTTSLIYLDIALQTKCLLGTFEKVHLQKLLGTEAKWNHNINTILHLNSRFDCILISQSFNTEWKWWLEQSYSWLKDCIAVMFPVFFYK